MKKNFYEPIENLVKFEDQEQIRSLFREKLKKRVMFPDEKEVFAIYTHPESNMKPALNDYLKITSGKIVDTSKPNDKIYQELLKKYTPEQIEKMSKDIEKLDAGVWRNQTPEPMYVYEFTNENRLSLPANSLRDENGKIDFEKVQKIKEQYEGQTFKKVTYLDVSFLEKETHWLPVMFEYIVDQGTHGAYYDRDDHNEPKMLIGRNQWIKIIGVSIVEDKQTPNIQILKIKCILVANRNENENQYLYFF